jgi:acetylornithine deacetylase/succinyl-diaminopimelate desuccinylase-like protein
VSDAERVSAAVDALRDECAAFLQQLVRIPTVNPPGERYEDCARADVLDRVPERAA